MKLYTSNLEKVKVASKQEAMKLRHMFVTAEHLLLAILSTRDSQAANFLRKKGISYSKVYKQIAELLGKGSKKQEDPPRSLRNIMLFHNAEDLAQTYNKPVGTLHLLWAILDEFSCEAAQVLVKDEDEAKSWCSDIEDLLAEPTTRRPEVLSFRSKGSSGSKNNKWRRRLSECGEELKKNVVVTESTITRIVDTLTRSWAGFLGSSRPIASFLFIGPRGSGRMTLARNLAKFLFNDLDRVYRLDLADFSEEGRAAQFIGSSGQESLLGILNREFPFGVIYIEGVEQAHPKVMECIHQILEKGHFMTSSGRRLDFRDHIIILSISMDAEFFKNANMGFRRNKDKEEDSQDQYDRLLMPDIETVLRPDTISLADETVFFPPISDKGLLKLLDTWIEELSKELKREHNLNININEAVKFYLIKKSEEVGHGATSLRRLFSREIGSFVAKAILEHTANRGDSIVLSEEDKQISISILPKNNKNS
ncbi:MAG: AAA family ATPase [Candidatus Bruticola sp.]